MVHTDNLSLPHLLPGQALKHITHNDALERLDWLVHPNVLSMSIANPPTSPEVGDAYIVPAAPAGDWANIGTSIARWNGNRWEVIAPFAGLTSWVSDDNLVVIFDGSVWSPVNGLDPSGDATTFATLGVNATPDTSNRLSVKAEAALLSHDDTSGDMRLTINKETSDDVSSLIFQSGWSGRAELGLVGNDSLRFRVSSDGSNFTDGLIIDQASGVLTAPNGLRNPQVGQIDYSDSYSTGDRSALITIFGNFLWAGAGGVGTLVNGDDSDADFYAPITDQTGRFIDIALAEPRRIGEFKFLLSHNSVGTVVSHIKARRAAHHGWFQVSGDAVWSDHMVGTELILPCHASEPFQEYRIVAVSGSTYSSPWWNEMKLGIMHG